MPSVIQPREACPRAEYISPNKGTSITIEAEGLTPEQIEQIMARALEGIADARGVTKPRLVADRTRLALAAALDAAG